MRREPLETGNYDTNPFATTKGGNTLLARANDGNSPMVTSKGGVKPLGRTLNRGSG